MGDIVVTRKMYASSKIDDRWNSEPHEVIVVPCDEIPVYKIRHVLTGKTVNKHRNSLLPLFEPIAIIDVKDNGKKADPPQQPLPIVDDDLEEHDEVIITVPIVHPEQSVIDEIAHDDENDAQTGENADQTDDNGGQTEESDDEMSTPLKRSDRDRHSPDKYSPSTYKAIILSTRL